MSHDQAAPRPLFKSDLAQTLLPEVLATTHRYLVSGVVECTRDEETKRIYIEAGNIIFATSSNTVDSLGDRLLSEGKISREQYTESVRLLQDGDKRQGTILAEMQAIHPKDLFVAVREQVQAIVWSLFEWDRGLVTFEPGRDKHREFIKLDISIQRAVLEGVRFAEAKTLLSRVGPKTTILEIDPDSERNAPELTQLEKRLLSAIDGKKSLSQLTQVPPLSAVDNARLLYAFFVLRLVRPKTPKQIKVQVRSSNS